MTKKTPEAIKEVPETFKNLLSAHAPHDLSEAEFLDVYRLHQSKQPIDILVLALDIRRSTMLMKEAIRFDTYAVTIGGYIEYAEQLVRSHGGWFDKFTGDGFLAFWRFDFNNVARTLKTVLGVSKNLIDKFNTETADKLRKNSKNIPRGIGVGLGLDAGPGYMEMFAKDITLLGSPVVGAVRMEHLCAEPDDIYCNSLLGDSIYRSKESYIRSLQIERRIMNTKEYPDGQEIYKLKLL